MIQLKEFFLSQPVFGPDQQDILTMLQTPSLVAPYSLQEQLAYIREKWGGLLGDFLLRILGGLDLIKEEQRALFGGPGPALIPDYRKLRGMLDLEKEQFSPDSDWMPRVVLMAKNSYVWLYQLSRKYQREINRLDQIPDEELDFLAKAGITGLWLIGLWERSKASEDIKKMCGNPEAVASAYSIAKYEIAGDLGGEPALQNLKQRAWQRGMRLASDMVPNHMGIDSDWLTHQPDDFIGLDYSPFPSYSFNGPNLSRDPNIGIFLEDHYYNRQDAAVVFRWTDFRDGRQRFIYHGNDGTNMPWNDTAQLNYLKADVREKVIQQILQVARNFPIIRFDAAMTLAKKHYQRLWFPEPGAGGDIPTRSEHAISRQRFDELFPTEFWREVVDRVAREVPDTLLLAEAFWLMEGYFVRTLGMHRVYNSAFMNMMRNEDNAKYRSVIKNTIEFDPDILKRFVNFMNNPDERTAVEQFGKGDKYFGICLLMVTLPGLPMLGHGQIEGYSEKYGMEYRKAYLEEYPDSDLVSRHEWEIFPLIHQRHLFSGVEQFRIFDFHRPDGSVDENVFAYTNGHGDRRTLVVFQNKYASTSGTIHHSSPYLQKATGKVQTTSLADSLGLHNGSDFYVILHDHISGMDWLFPSSQIIHQGFSLQLEAYKYHAFTDITEVQDDTNGTYGQLFSELRGHPVHNLHDRIRLVKYRALHMAIARLLEPEAVEFLIPRNMGTDQQVDVSNRLDSFLNELDHLFPISSEQRKEMVRLIFQKASIIHGISTGETIPALQTSLTWKRTSPALLFNKLNRTDQILSWVSILLDSIASQIPSQRDQVIHTLLEDLSLALPVKDLLMQLEIGESQAWFEISMLECVLSQQTMLLSLEQDLVTFWNRLIADRLGMVILGVNESQGFTWVRKESTQRMLHWLTVLDLLRFPDKTEDWNRRVERWIVDINGIEKARIALAGSGCRVDLFLDRLVEEKAPRS
jgi:glycosidase